MKNSALLLLRLAKRVLDTYIRDFGGIPRDDDSYSARYYRSMIYWAQKADGYIREGMYQDAVINASRSWEAAKQMYDSGPYMGDDWKSTLDQDDVIDHGFRD